MSQQKNVVECPNCGMPIRLWENFNASAKDYEYPNRKEVNGKPFYVCHTCGYFLFAGKRIFTYKVGRGEWIPFKVAFIFR